jgi:hypothetical protein
MLTIGIPLLVLESLPLGVVATALVATVTLLVFIALWIAARSLKSQM